MQRCTLKFTARAPEDVGKNAVRRLRTRGFTPANLLSNGKSQSVQILTKDFNELRKKGLMTSTLIELENEKKKDLCLLKTVQTHPVDGTIVHIDFYHITADQKVNVPIPIVGIGVPIGVKAGGILEQKLGSVKIKTYAKSIIEKLEVDLSGLEIGDSFKMQDLELPKEWETTVPADAIVFKVSHSRLAAVEETTQEVSAAEVPTVKPKKEDSGGEKESG